MKILHSAFAGAILWSMLTAITFIIPQNSNAQCTGISTSAATTESRCEASGILSITVNGAVAGSNLSYAIITAPAQFPISQLNHFQSANNFPSLPPGNYSVVTKIDDGGNTCMDTVAAIVTGNYTRLDLNVSSTDNTACTSQSANGSIQLQGINGRTMSSGTYQYEIISPSAFIQSNTTGLFTALPANTYTVRVSDSCGNFQTRDVTIIDKNTYTISLSSLYGTACDTMQAQIFIADAAGKPVSSTAGFTYSYYDDSGNFLPYQFLPNSTFYIAPILKDTLTIFVQDPCGNITTVFGKTDSIFYLGGSTTQAITSANCSSFNANFRRGLVNIGSDPIFTISCASDASLIGQTNTTGIFNGLPFGSYCIHVADACGRMADFHIADTNALIIPPLRLHFCTADYGSVTLNAGFQATPPLKVEVIDNTQGNTVIQTHVYNSLFVDMIIADSLPTNDALTFKYTDACGNVSLSSALSLIPSTLQRSFSIQPLCINKANVDVHVNTTGPVDVVFFTISGPAAFTDHYGFVVSQNNTKTYANLPAGTYYTSQRVGGCAQVYLDTITIDSYVQPALSNVTTFDCDNSILNDYAINFATSGGIAPYSYEVTGSIPNNIVRAPQSTPYFSGFPKDEIVQLRTFDGCGNSASNAVAIKKLEPANISSQGITCPGNTITLFASAIPNAQYTWSFNSSIVSSGLLDTVLTITNFSNLDTGTYLCDVVPASGCQAVQSSTVVHNDCMPLPLSTLDFSGKRIDNVVQLQWKIIDEDQVIFYEIYKLDKDQNFTNFKRVLAEGSTSKMSNYFATDNNVGSDAQQYKLKIVYQDGSIRYSKVVSIEPTTTIHYNVSPNPFSDHVVITTFNVSATNTVAQLYDVEGRLVLTERWMAPAGTSNKTINIGKKYGKSIYILKISVPGHITGVTRLIKSE